MQKIELVNPLPELVEGYKKVVALAIQRKLITLKEWNAKYKFIRDSYGYSIIHYFESVLNKVGRFITDNPLMIENRRELQDRFGIAVYTLQEFLDEEEMEERKK